MHGLPPAALVEPHLWIVDHFVTRYQPQAPHADLHAAGVLGLVEAADRFNPRGGRKFPTYAWLWVKGQVLREVRRSHLVTVPEHDVRRANAAGTPVRTRVWRSVPELNPTEWQNYGEDETASAGRGPANGRWGIGCRRMLAAAMVTLSGDPEQERRADHGMRLRALGGCIRDLPDPLMRRAVRRTLAGDSVAEVAVALSITQARVVEILDAAGRELRERMT